jgi:hypothetical protein
MQQNPWQTATVVWKEFCANNPVLGLLGERWSWVHFQRTHGQKMRELGVLRQTTTGRYLLNIEKFPDAAFEYLTTQR